MVMVCMASFASAITPNAFTLSILDSQGETITDANFTVTVYDVGSTAATIYANPNMGAKTNPMARANDDDASRGVVLFYGNANAYDIGVSSNGGGTGETAYTGVIKVSNVGTTDHIIYYPLNEMTGNVSAGTITATGATSLGGNTTFGINGTGVDVTFFSDTTGDWAIWDMSADSLLFVGSIIGLDDDSDLKFGTDNDWAIDCDTAKTLDLIPAVTDETAIINIGADTAGADLKLFGATTGEYFLWDASGDDLIANLDSVLMTTTGAAANQFKVDATGTIAGYGIVFETTDGGVQINADGASNGDITIDAADDITLTAASDLVLAVTGNITGDALFTGEVTGKKNIITTTTTPVAVTAVNTGSVYVSYGVAAGAANCVFTLPTCAAGLTYTFVDANSTADDDLWITANTGDKINGGTAAKSFKNTGDVYGAGCTVVGIDDENWIAIPGAIGTFANDNN